jgi:hypothetical protein
MSTSNRFWPQFTLPATVLLNLAGARSAHVGRTDATLVEEVPRERR